MTGRQHPRCAERLLVCFLPVNPSFGERREDNRIRLRLFCFLPVNLSFVAAFAALKVSFPGACPGKDGFFILTKRQRVIASLNPFSLRATLSFSKYVFAGAKTNYYNKNCAMLLCRLCSGVLRGRMFFEYHSSSIKMRISSRRRTCAATATP